MFWIEMTLFFEAKNDLKWPEIKVNWLIVEQNDLIWRLIISKGLNWFPLLTKMVFGRAEVVFWRAEMVFIGVDLDPVDKFTVQVMYFQQQEIWVSYLDL